MVLWVGGCYAWNSHLRVRMGDRMGFKGVLFRTNLKTTQDSLKAIGQKEVDEAQTFKDVSSKINSQNLTFPNDTNQSFTLEFFSSQDILDAANSVKCILTSFLKEFTFRFSSWSKRFLWCFGQRLQCVFGILGCFPTFRIHCSLFDDFE